MKVWLLLLPFLGVDKKSNIVFLLQLYINKDLDKLKAMSFSDPFSCIQTTALYCKMEEAFYENPYQLEAGFISKFQTSNSTQFQKY
jgi:hypothetical protein